MEFTLAGDGKADLTSGTTELRLDADPGFPDGFDPALTQFMCNFPLAGFTAVPAGPAGLRDAVTEKMFVRPRRQITISDESGEPVVHLEALTTLSLEQDAISVTNYLTGFSRLPVGVVNVSGEETLIPGAPGTATGVAQYRVELEGGQVLDGLTVVPYRFDRTAALVSAASRVIGNQVCERISVTEVTLRATSRWHELSFTPVTPGA